MGASGRLGAARGAVPARESASGRSELERGARTAAGGRRGEYASPTDEIVTNTLF